MRKLSTCQINPYEYFEITRKLKLISHITIHFDSNYFLENALSVDEIFFVELFEGKIPFHPILQFYFSR